MPEDLVSGPGTEVGENSSVISETVNSNVDETVSGFTNTEDANQVIGESIVVENNSETNTGDANNNSQLVDNILGDNVHIEGANIIQNPDGSIQIGGTPQEGATIIQQGEEHDHNEEGEEGEQVSEPLILPNYDYTQPPIFGDDQIVVSGNDITSARGGMSTDNYGQTQYVVDLAFTEEGKQKFAEATERNLGMPIYIIYNGDIVSAPYVQSVISDGRAQITGMENLEAAERLASTIRIGALKLELEVLRSNVVGAKLGQDAISTSLKAGLIGFAIIGLVLILWKTIIPVIRHNRRS